MSATQYCLFIFHHLICYAIVIIIYQSCRFEVQLLTIRVPAGVSIYNVPAAFSETLESLQAGFCIISAIPQRLMKSSACVCMIKEH